MKTVLINSSPKVKGSTCAKSGFTWGAGVGIGGGGASVQITGSKSGQG